MSPATAQPRRFLPGLTRKDGLLRHPFDITYGVRTSGLVAGRYLKSGHAHDRHSTAYYGVAPSVFHGILRRWRRSRPAFPVEETTFVDIGAGMGRAALLAAELPFQQVIGVELHPTLVRIARRNLSVWRKNERDRCPMKVIAADAVDFVFPAGPCIAFLFNPFGATVMRRWLRSMGKTFASRPRELDLLYVNNEQEGVLEEFRNQRTRSSASPNLHRLFLGPIKRSRADRIADDAILNNQPEGEYASAPHEDCSMWRWS